MKKLTTALAFVVLAASASLASATEYLHKIHFYPQETPGNQISLKLDELGSQGWRLVAVTHIPSEYEGHGSVQYTFTKEK